MVQDLRWTCAHQASAVGLTDVHAAVIPALAFKPALHVHYQVSVLKLRDSLPKQKDVP